MSVGGCGGSRIGAGEGGWGILEEERGLDGEKRTTRVVDFPSGEINGKV